MITTESNGPAFDAEFVSARISLAVDYSKPCIKFCRDAAIALNNLGHNYPRSGIVRDLSGDKGYYERQQSNYPYNTAIPLSALPPHLVRSREQMKDERQYYQSWHYLNEEPSKFDLLANTRSVFECHCPSSCYYDWRICYGNAQRPFPSTPYISRLAVVVFPIGIKPVQYSGRERNRDILFHLSHEIEKLSPVHNFWTLFIGVGDGTDKDVEKTLIENDIHLSTSFFFGLAKAFKPSSKGRKAFAKELMRFVTSY